jgi:hypothetical protein
MKVKFTQITGDVTHGLYALDEHGSVWERVYNLDRGATWQQIPNPERFTHSNSGGWTSSPNTNERI